MHLDVRGHPLHTRAVTVAVSQRADRRLAVAGRILDLRKRGFVPVAGDLQSTGVVHDMQLDCVFDPATQALTRMIPQQRSVAFEPSAMSAGESCRDPMDRVAALAGTVIDGDYPRRLSAAIGGPRGCSHILTLAQLLGSTVTWALARDRERVGAKPARWAGEKVYRRDVIIDGHEAAAGKLQLAFQLNDLHWAPAPPVARPMDRFAAQHEVRGLAQIDLSSWSLADVAAAERRRSYEDLEGAAWHDRAATLQGLAGLSLLQGVSAELIRRFNATGDDRPLLDTLLMLAPALIQCAAALSEAWPLRAKQNQSFMATGGLPDSCYMWRREGALFKIRGDESSEP